jgi:RNA polymerase sigma factor (sigma-70 family)
MPDDAELLRRYVLERSDQAFAEVVVRHVDLVYSTALRQVSADVHRAHDIVQLVFATLARKSSMLLHHPLLAGWLYTTTVHLARRMARDEQRRRTREAEAIRMSEMERDTSKTIDWDRIRPVLDDVMCELRERDREAIVLRFFGRQPFAKIGRALGLSEDAARMRVDRALEKLRTGLGNRGVSSTGAALSLALASQAVTAAPAGAAAGIAASAVAISGAGLTAAFAAFMSTSKIFLTGAAVFVLLAAGTAVHAIRASHEADAALAIALREHAERRAQSRDATARAISLEDEATRAQGELAAIRIKEVAERTRTAAPLDGEALMQRHPELKQIAIEGQRARVIGFAAPLFKLLQLTPAQIERFTDLAMQGIRGTFTGPAGEMVGYSFGGDRRQAQIELQELLGADGFELYKNYYDVIGPAWQIATQLAGDLFCTATPLTADQGAQLQRILVDGRATSAWSSRPQYDWGAIMTRAKNVLQPQQLTALEDISTSDKLSQAMVQARVRGEIK